MNVALRQIQGPWDDGWVLDKHTISSTPVGTYPNGRTMFDTRRTEVGEATYRLKYNGDWDQVLPLARAVVQNVCPLLDRVGFVVPMPASNTRARQPVVSLAEAVGGLLKIYVATDLLLKAPGGPSLKDLSSKAEKLEAIGDRFSVVDRLAGDGPWNVLLVDDLFHTGASMEAACKVLRAYRKVAKIYVAALTWR